MARKNFNNIDIYAGIQKKNGQQWQKENGISANWRTPEQIDIQPVYTKEDLEGMEHLDFTAGIPPYLRGPYSTGFRQRAWAMQAVCFRASPWSPFCLKVAPNCDLQH